MGEGVGVRVSNPGPVQVFLAERRAPTILVVEDEAVIRAAIAVYLHDGGFTVLEAQTADEAIAILESEDVSVDVLFSDIGPPRATNGLSLAQWVRDNRPNLPVVLTSGNSEMAEPAKKVCGNSRFVPKPFDVSNLVAIIRTAIETGDMDPA